MHLQGPRTFLARPFWRDYVVAYVLIGLGFMLSGPTSPVHPTVGVAMFTCGAVVFVCAVGWSLSSAWQSWRAEACRSYQGKQP